MSRPPHARTKVLDAFEAILVDEGEKGATLEAVAALAGVSKGGLLYHFASKDELERALGDRLRALVAADVDEAQQAPGGPVRHYISTSTVHGDALDRAYIAVSRLAHGGSAGALAALQQARLEWTAMLRPHVRDAAALDLVLLLGDGLYVNASLTGQGVPVDLPRGEALEALLALVERATAPAG